MIFCSKRIIVSVGFHFFFILSMLSYCHYSILSVCSFDKLFVLFFFLFVCLYAFLWLVFVLYLDLFEKEIKAMVTIPRMSLFLCFIVLPFPIYLFLSLSPSLCFSNVSIRCVTMVNKACLLTTFCCAH